MNFSPVFEVETRAYFTSPAEAFALIPFLKEALINRNQWSTTHYGFQLFKEDNILRIGQAIDERMNFSLCLGWKGKDHGKFANIREEIDEEITNGIEDSRIFSIFSGQATHNSPQSVLAELTRLGFDPFMTFHGFNQTGFYEPLGIHLKLMHCDSLEKPYLVEIEKTASSLEDAFSKEQDLRQITEELELTNRILREEPPALFFATLTK